MARDANLGHSQSPVRQFVLRDQRLSSVGPEGLKLERKIEARYWSKSCPSSLSLPVRTQIGSVEVPVNCWAYSERYEAAENAESRDPTISTSKSELEAR